MLILWTILPNRRGSRTLHFTQASTNETPPSDSQPCTVTKSNTSITLTSRQPSFQTLNNLQANVQLFTSSIQSQIHGSLDILTESFISQTILIATDGSYKHPYGAGSWIITTEQLYPLHYITGSVQSPGYPTDQDSHRAEASAILGAINYLKSSDLYNKNTEIKFLLGCDNTSALHYALDIQKISNY